MLGKLSGMVLVPPIVVRNRQVGATRFAKLVVQFGDL